MPDRAPFISILTASYNYEAFLQKYFKGIEEQTFKNFEIVFINDGSQDRTMEILNSFRNKHPEISFQVIDQENHGLTYCRNLALRKARGTYVMFHDTDDWMDPDCLELFAKTAKATNADRIIGAFREVDATGRILQIRSIAENASKWLYVAIQASLYKISLFRENKIQIPKVHRDDYYINNLVNCYAKTVAWIKKPTFNFLLAGISFFSSQNKKDPSTAIWSFQEQIAFYQQHYQLIEGNREDEIMMEYQFIKAYYTMITFYNNYNTTMETLKNYRKLHKLMKEACPNYLKNKNNYLFGGENGGRASIQRKTWILITLEKLHLFQLALWCYKQFVKIHPVKI